MGRVLAVGLDTIDERDLLRRIDAGTMPNLSALRARGVWCSLQLDDLCRSEHAWPTFFSGREPTSRGRWTAIEFDPATYRYRSTDDDAGDEPFWALGEEAAVVVLDVPEAPLARDFRGIQIRDWFAHEPVRGRHVESLRALARLEQVIGKSPARPLEYGGTWNDTEWLRRIGPALVVSAEMRTDAIEHLLATTPDWSLGVVVYGEPHQLMHHVAHAIHPESVLHGTPSTQAVTEVLDALTDAIDAQIGRLAAALEPDDVLVLFMPKGSQSVCDLALTTLVPELFHRLAFGEGRLRQPSVARWVRRGRRPIVLPAGMSYVVAMRASFGTSRVARIFHAGRLAVSRIAQRIAPVMTGRMRIDHRVRQGTKLVVRDADSPSDDAVGEVPNAPAPYDCPYDDWYVGTWYRPWWPKMRAFVLPSFSEVHVRINLVGRERDGIVAPADYAAACDEVEATLRSCRNPRTGNPVFGAAVRPRGDDPFAGVGLAADVVISQVEDTDVLEHPEVGIVGPYPAWRSGGHSASGFAVFAGADIGCGEIVSGRLVDLTATILDLVGATPPAALDGTPLPLPHRGAVSA